MARGDVMEAWHDRLAVGKKTLALSYGASYVKCTGKSPSHLPSLARRLLSRRDRPPQ